MSAGRRGVLSAALVALAMLVSACSGKGGTAAPDKGAVKAKFVAAADGICERVSSETAPRVIELFSVRSTPPELAQSLGTIVPALEKGFADLRRLRPPAGDDATIGAMITAGETEVARLRDIAARAGGGDETSVGAFLDPPPFVSFDEKAGAYGLARCALARNPADPVAISEAQRGAFAPDKKAYIEKADAACTQFGGEKFVSDPFYVAGSSGPKPMELRAQSLGTTFLYFFRQQVQALRAVEPPAADRERISAALGAYDQVFVKGQSAADAGKGGDRSGFQSAFVELAAMALGADRALFDYGLTKCASSQLLFQGVAQRAPRLP